jgi:hypothetical protein
MSTSLNEFKSTVLESLLELLWRQWSALGVSGSSRTEEQTVVDPEALLLLTLTVARYDMRLFNEVFDWVDENGAFLNVHRLKNLVKQYDFKAKPQLSALAERAGRNSSFALKWKNLAAKYVTEQSEPLFFLKTGRPYPLPESPDGVFLRHGLMREPFQPRGLAQPFPAAGMPSLLLRLRALLGVNIRCEILCVLGTVGEIHPSLLAKRIAHAPRTTQNALSEMVRSGVIQVRTSSREKLYSLQPGMLAELLHPGEERTRWGFAAPMFRALEILWLVLIDPDRQNLEEAILASEWRRTARDMRPFLGEAKWGQHLRDDSQYKGKKYAEIFEADIRGILKRLVG